MRRPTGPGGRHLDARAVLDYLESRTDAASRRAVEEHLGRPCRACRDLLWKLGWLVERMRLDRTPPVPDRLRARALAVFETPPVPSAAGRVLVGLARLLFDSSTQPIPAAAHRAVGELRRLRFALGSDVLELESEIESSETRTVRGHLHASDPSLHRVEMVVGSERFSTRPDASGAFVFDRVPLGRARMTFTEARNRYRIPALE
jgi:hypothetical protein